MFLSLNYNRSSSNGLDSVYRCNGLYYDFSPYVQTISRNKTYQPSLRIVTTIPHILQTAADSYHSEQNF